MISFLDSLVSRADLSQGRFFRSVSVLFAAGVLSSASLLAQAEAGADAANPNGRARRGQNGQAGAERGGRGNFDPQQMQQQRMERLREQFGITDDAEWKLIETRITAVTELRVGAGGGLGAFGGGRGGQGGPGGAGGGGRGARANANPEQEALRVAVTDKLPDAEIKSRLARLRESRKANEEKLTKAQEELRALLSVRQEAVAVMMGLLP